MNLSSTEFMHWRKPVLIPVSRKRRSAFVFVPPTPYFTVSHSSTFVPKLRPAQDRSFSIFATNLPLTLSRLGQPINIMDG
jgi:hypothetical protein